MIIMLGVFRTIYLVMSAPCLVMQHELWPAGQFLSQRPAVLAVLPSTELSVSKRLGTVHFLHVSVHHNTLPATHFLPQHRFLSHPLSLFLHLHLCLYFIYHFITPTYHHFPSFICHFVTPTYHLFLHSINP